MGLFIVEHAKITLFDLVCSTIFCCKDKNRLQMKITYVNINMEMVQF